MKTTTQNPVFAKIRLYLKILASCVIVTCLFLIIIHPEAWITPSCIIVAMICLLFLLIRAKRKDQKNERNIRSYHAPLIPPLRFPVLDTTFHRIYGSAVLSRIGRQLHFLFSQQHSRLAYIPSMIIYCFIWPVIPNPDGIKVT